MYIKRKNNRETSNIIVFFDLYWIFIMLVAAALCLIFDFIHISRAIQCCSVYNTTHTHRRNSFAVWPNGWSWGHCSVCECGFTF